MGYLQNLLRTCVIMILPLAGRCSWQQRGACRCRVTPAWPAQADAPGITQKVLFNCTAMVQHNGRPKRAVLLLSLQLLPASREQVDTVEKNGVSSRFESLGSAHLHQVCQLVDAQPPLTPGHPWPRAMVERLHFVGSAVQNPSKTNKHLSRMHSV